MRRPLDLQPAVSQDRRVRRRGEGVQALRAQLRRRDATPRCGRLSRGRRGRVPLPTGG